MAHHVLKIILRGNGNPRGRGKKGIVEPGHCSVENSDMVTWEADETDVVLFFPHRQLFGRREVEIRSGGQETLTVSDTIGKGRYPYAVYCVESEDFAEGGSSPIMIVR